MRGSKAAAIAFMLMLAFVVNAAAVETTIGRWCDRTVPNAPKYNRIIAIVLAEDGKVVARSKFGDGSSSVNQLQEAAGSIFVKIGSRFGDKYRIVPSTGNLQLLDNDGLIRIASRLENTPRSDECLD